MYADYTVDLRNGPAAMYDNVRMPPTNPFIPPDLQLLLDSRADPTENVVLDKLMSELGPRVQSFEYDVYQATLGLRGKVFAGWSYDAYLQIGANDQTETQSGNALTSKIEDLTFAPDGGVAICGGFNPFGDWIDLSRVRSVYRRRREQPGQCRSDDLRGLAERTAPSIAGWRAARGVRGVLQEGPISLQRQPGGERKAAGRA